MKESKSVQASIDTTTTKIEWRQQKEIGCCQTPIGLVPPTVTISIQLGLSGYDFAAFVANQHECGIVQESFTIQITHPLPNGEPERWYFEIPGAEHPPTFPQPPSTSYIFGQDASGHEAPLGDFPVPFDDISGVVIVAGAKSACGIWGYGAAQWWPV